MNRAFVGLIALLCLVCKAVIDGLDIDGLELDSFASSESLKKSSDSLAFLSNTCFEYLVDQI